MGNEITKMLQSSLDAGKLMQDKANALKESMRVLSQGANEQAASLEESAAAIEEMSSSMHNVSERTSDVIRQSEEIKSVIGIIRDIADQTNLLALEAKNPLQNRSTSLLFETLSMPLYHQLL